MLENDKMLANANELLNTNEAETMQKLSEIAGHFTRGNTAWEYFVEWLFTAHGKAARKENSIEINVNTGEIYLFGDNLKDENLFIFLDIMTDPAKQETSNIWFIKDHWTDFVCTTLLKQGKKMLKILTFVHT